MVMIIASVTLLIETISNIAARAVWDWVIVFWTKEQSAGEGTLSLFCLDLSTRDWTDFIGAIWTDFRNVLLIAKAFRYPSFPDLLLTAFKLPPAFSLN